MAPTIDTFCHLLSEENEHIRPFNASINGNPEIKERERTSTEAPCILYPWSPFREASRDEEIAFLEIYLLTRCGCILVKAPFEPLDGGICRLGENDDIIRIGEMAYISIHGREDLNTIFLSPRISLSSDRERKSAAITKRAGEMGSPCLSPLVDMKKPDGVPLTKTENQQHPTHRLIKLFHPSGNPIFSRILRRKGHWTLS